MIVERRIELSFGAASRDALTHANLSAVRQDGRCLWVAGDETATVERLTARPDVAGRPAGYENHRTFRLADFVELPAGPDAEADIEGLARCDGWLWAVGSHSLKRKRIKRRHAPAKARRRLATVVREENRFVLIRLPIVEVGGLPEPRRAVVVDGQVRTAALLGGRGDSLAELLADDPHLAPFLAIPGKDNGLDVEGVAAHGDHLYIGLRGPVLRGWAVLVEIRPVSDPHDPHRLVAAPLGDGGERYRTHFVDLGGLGIRDLCPHGDDLLILTGPSMDLDGPVRVVRWPEAARIEAPAVVPAETLETLGELPYGAGDDHAEGIAVLDEPAGGPGRLLVVYDSPAAERHTPRGSVYADIVALAGADAGHSRSLRTDPARDASTGAQRWAR